MPETMEHLIFTCYFSRNFWWKIGQEWNLDLPFMDMLEEAEKRSQNPFLKIVMIAGSWSIWNHMTIIIFDQIQIYQEICYSFFK
jgi:hypothetical protein